MKEKKMGKLTQPRKAEISHDYVDEHKIPAEETEKPLTTQKRKSEIHKGQKQPAKQEMGEQMYPANFNRFGSNFVDTKRVKKGL